MDFAKPVPVFLPLDRQFQGRFARAPRKKIRPLGKLPILRLRVGLGERQSKRECFLLLDILISLLFIVIKSMSHFKNNNYKVRLF